MPGSGFEESGVILVLDTQQYQRNVAAAIATGGQLDEMLDEIVSAAGEAEGALSAIGDLDVSVGVETDTAALDTLEADLATFSGEDYDATASVTPDETDLNTFEGELNQFSQEEYAADATVDPNGQPLDVLEGDLAGFDTSTYEAEASVAPEDIDFEALQADLVAFDTESVDALATAVTERAALDALSTDLTTLDGVEVDPKIDAQVTGKEDVASISTSVKSIAETGLKAAAGVAAIVAALGGGAIALAAKSFLDMDSALDNIEAKTGRLLPGTEELVTKLYNQGFGQSREEVSNLIVLMDQLGISQKAWGEAAESAFKTARVTGKPVEEVLGTMQRLVSTNLSESFTGAGDTLVAGFQQGADRAGDFFSTISSNASVLKDMGFDANSFTERLIVGLQGGLTSANEVANSLINVRGRLSDNSQEVQDAVDSLDLTDETQAYLSGQESAEEWLRGFTEQLDKIEDPAKRLEVTNALFGRQARGIGQGAIEGLGKVSTAMDNVAGRADAANDVIDRDFGQSLTKTFRTLEGKVIDFLSSDQVDLPTKLAVLETQLQTFIDNVQAGKSIAESVDIAFQLPDNAFEKIESTFNNIAIGFLQAIQSVLELLGKSKEAEDLGKTIAGYAQGQFEFDLRLADNGEGLRDSIQTAIDRGIDPEKITATLQDAAEDMLARGDLTGAQKLIDQIKEQATVPIKIEGVEFAPGTSFEDVYRTVGGGEGAFAPSREELQKQFDEATSVQNIDTSSLDENAQILAQQYQDKYNEAILAGDYATALDAAKQLSEDPAVIESLQFMIDKQTELQTETGETATANEDAASRTSTALDDTKQSVAQYATDAASNLSTNMTDFDSWSQHVTKAIGDVSGKVGGLAGSIDAANASLTTLQGNAGTATNTGTPGTGTPAPAQPRAGGGGVRQGQTVRTGEHGMEYFTAPQPGSIINAANTSVLQRALAQIGIGGGNTTNNYITLNNTANTQSVAQADAFGYRSSRQVRGFA